MTRYLICGDRNWDDEAAIAAVIDGLITKGDVVINGAQRGADRIAGKLAKARGLETLDMADDWTLLGNRAGPIRNRAMLNQGNPDVVIAFHDDLWESRGTRHMVTIARAAGLPVKLWSHATGTLEEVIPRAGS